VAKIVLDRIRERFGDAVLETSSAQGDEVAVIAPDRWLDVASFARTDPACAMDHFIDLTCVDWPKRAARFEVVLMLRSSTTGKRIRLKARVPETDPKIASVTGLWLGANWFEREAYDMFGVIFEGHPDLRRILLYDEFEGHPLRKDYDAAKTQPLVPYRPEALDKLPPFGKDEGMPWERPVRPGREHSEG